MLVHIVAVGRVKERALRTVLDDYLGRIRRYAKLAETELKDGDESTVQARFEKAIDPRGRTVALEVLGKPWSSHRLADEIGHCQLHSVPTLTFLIGGSYGLPPTVSRAADARMSMSAMTFPHRLVRVMLAEQVYRGFSILKNEPYSH
ncbi:MAG: 23S rRNA (pseudouridine(1915)-N(3))-methyltransferase RlmH [Sandaracinaceae bacterium]